MNWMCDVYCYEDVTGGWTTHVASRRRVREPNPPFPDVMQPYEKFKEQYDTHHKDLEEIELKEIGLPHDGETFNDSNLNSFKDTLLMLKYEGYNVPDHVFDMIEEELQYD